MAWPGLGKCTAYPRLGQDSPPLGVRWFSEGLGLARIAETNIEFVVMQRCCGRNPKEQTLVLRTPRFNAGLCRVCLGTGCADQGVFHLRMDLVHRVLAR